MLPALTDHITRVAGAAGSVISAGIESEVMINEVKSFEALYCDIKTGISNLKSVLTEIIKEPDLHKQAHMYAEEGAEALDSLRESIDKAEELVADDLWPMAKYQELLLVL